MTQGLPKLYHVRITNYYAILPTPGAESFHKQLSFNMELSPSMAVFSAKYDSISLRYFQWPMPLLFRSTDDRGFGFDNEDETTSLSNKMSEEAADKITERQVGHLSAESRDSRTLSFIRKSSAIRRR